MNEKTLVQVFQEELAKASNNAHDFSGSSERLNWWIEMSLNAAIEAHEARKWQPIEDLKDGVNSLLISDGQIFIGAVHHPLNGPKYARITSGDLGALEPFPTHFQHLPQTPKEL